MRCPGTELHQQHMAHIRTLRTDAERQAYIEHLRITVSRFDAKWVADDLKALQSAAKQPATRARP